MKTVLVLYVPAIHSGYIALFEKYKDKAESLFILDQEVLADFTILEREIRAIKPAEAVRLIKGAGYFESVELANKAKLTELSQKKDIEIVLSQELISDTLVKLFFTDSKVVREDVFLRFDEKIVRAARKEIEFDGEISSEKFHQEAMQLASEWRAKGSDWFLTVGAAIAIDGKVVLAAYNARMPTDQSMAIDGDPRTYLPYGTDTHQRSSIHGEQAAIAEAAKRGLKLEGASIYVTAFPCPDCSQLIANAGFKELYFKEGYSQLSNQEILKAFSVKITKVV